MKMKLQHALFLILFVYMLFKFSTPITVVGELPSFARQEIRDAPGDWQYFSLRSNSNCTDVTTQSKKIPDMVGATYFSDNGFLNATIWLSAPFKETPSPLLRFPTYSMVIGIIQPNNASARVDYGVSIQWDMWKLGWTRTIEEHLSNYTRILEQDSNYSNFFDNTNNKGHINMSLDLRKISSPNQYFLGFMMLDGILKDRNACGLIDIMPDTVYVPPPEFNISTFPNPLEIKQGEEKTIELKINSSTLVSPSVLLNTTQMPQGIQIQIEPHQTNVPSAGVATSHITVKASDKAAPGSYTLPIFSKISFPITINASSLAYSLSANINRTLSSSPTTDNNSISSRIPQAKLTTSTIFPRPTYFTVVISTYPFEERFRDFWNTFGDLISLVGGGIAAGLSALLIDRLKNRSKNKSQNINERS